jgi:hypothetical protein
VPDVKKFTGKECKWLHSGFLSACMSSETCGHYPDELTYSMALQRGMDSLEKILTVAARSNIEVACERSCRSKEREDYADFQRSVCLPLIKR